MLGLLGVARRPGARPGRPPRRHAAGVQGGRRGAVRPRPGQGGLRHRDAGAGHQHAGPLRGAGAAGQVQRRGARRPDAGGVHPAHRPGRPPRHRRRGARRRGLVARRSTRGTWPGWPPPAPIRCAPASGRRTTWRSTWSARSARSRPGSCWSRRSPSSRRTGRWSAWPGRCSATPRPSRRTARRPPATTATSTSTSRCGWPSPTGRRRSPGKGSAQRRAAAVASLERLRVGDVIRVPSGRRAGLAVVLDPATGGFGEPRPLVLTQDRWAGRVSRRRLHRPGRGAGPDPGAQALQPPLAGRPPGPGRRGQRHRPGPARRPARRPAPRRRPARTTELASCARELRQHPCHACPEREEHARWAERRRRLERDTEELREQGGRPHRLAGPHVRPGRARC